MVLWFNRSKSTKVQFKSSKFIISDEILVKSLKFTKIRFCLVIRYFYTIICKLDLILSLLQSKSFSFHIKTFIRIMIVANSCQVHHTYNNNNNTQDLQISLFHYSISYFRFYKILLLISFIFLCFMFYNFLLTKFPVTMKISV